MRNALAAILTLPFVLGSPAVAQGTAEQGLQGDPAVQQSQDPPVTAQGTRSPNETNTDTRTPELYSLILQAWDAPVDLQGNPVAGGSTGRTGEPSPAAATAQGCGATSTELAARPGGSGTACPPGETEPFAPANR